MRVLNSFWFSPMTGGLIGVVQVRTDYDGLQYFIGNAEGLDKERDEQLIASTGARFPVEAGEAMFR